MQRGTFIALEGIDGSGKSTQLELLAERLVTAGYDVATFDFPRYGQPSSYFIKQYLNGAYGGVNDVSPYTAALFYALDRYEAATGIRAALDAGKIVLTDRFAASNLAHQGAKIGNAQERSGFYIWLDNLEFQLLGIPRPNVSIILQTPTNKTHAQMERRGERSYTDKKRDIHEDDTSHLDKTAQTYIELAQLFPRDFSVIDCMRGGELLSVEAITDLLWGKIEPLLPVKEAAATTTAGTSADTEAVLSVRLSLLAEIHQLARRELTLDGTSLQSPIVIAENDQAWAVTPDGLKPKLRKIYQQTMEAQRTAYLTFVQKAYDYLVGSKPRLAKARALNQACLAAQQVLPLATRTTHQITSEQVAPEETAALGIPEADKVLQTVAGLAFTANHTDQNTAVTLVSASPADELELLPDLLYQFSDQPLAQIRAEVASWPRDKQAATLQTYLGKLPEARRTEIFDAVSYNWDLVSDVRTLRALIPFATQVHLQPISPRLGYDVPDLIEKAGLTDEFEACFDRSLELYSKLQQAGLTTEAQYACLLGHRLRWSCQIKLTSLQALAEAQLAPPNKQLYRDMLTMLAGGHPVLVRTLTTP